MLAQKTLFLCALLCSLSTHCAFDVVLTLQSCSLFSHATLFSIKGKKICDFAGRGKCAREPDLSITFHNQTYFAAFPRACAQLAVNSPATRKASQMTRQQFFQKCLFNSQIPSRTETREQHISTCKTDHVKYHHNFLVCPQNDKI